MENIPGAQIGAEFTQSAVNTEFPTLGAGFVAFSLLFFAFTTIMAYYYIAETNLSYLDKKGRKWGLWALRLLLLIATFYGTIKTAESAWTLGDIGVGIMAWLNVVAIILLRKPAFLALKDYQTQRKKGVEEPVFNPKSLGIKNTEVWE